MSNPVGVLEFMLLLQLALSWEGPPTREQLFASRREVLDGWAARCRPLPTALLQRPPRDPALVAWWLPYQDWETEYKDYFRLHCRDAKHRLRPGAVCMHYTVTRSALGVYNGFVRGGNMWKGDGVQFGHPSVQLMVDRDGTVYQLMPLDWRCTGAYGVNHVALSVEMVAMDEEDLLSRPEQVHASFCLVRWLMRRYGIPLERVWGHNEVGMGVVSDFLDYADKDWPDCYPLEARRLDPGDLYMSWLRAWLEAHP